MKSFGIFFVILCLSLAQAQDIDHLIFKAMSGKPLKEQFKVFHYLFKKPYDLNSEISLSKYRIFKANIKTIEEHNKVNTDFVQGITFFADFSREEYVDFATNQVMLENRAKLTRETNQIINFDDISDEDDDTEVIAQNEDKYPNFRETLGKTKDQRTCGGCWAFATSEMVEYAIYNTFSGKKEVLSPQSLIDCDIYSSNEGCNGGDFPEALRFVKNTGIALESEYPYRAYKSTCKSTSSKYKIKEYKTCQRYYGNGCKAELKRDMKNGIVGIGIDITAPGWQFYRGGWFTNPCYKVAHAVVAFYRDEEGVYFLNSWGEYGWGENKGAGRVKYTGEINGLITCGIENESHIAVTALVA